MAEQSSVVDVVEFFSCEVSTSFTALCIVMEHLDKNLADFLGSLGDEDGQNNPLTLDYSVSVSSNDDSGDLDEDRKSASVRPSTLSRLQRSKRK